jgi:hypothetical protein
MTNVTLDIAAPSADAAALKAPNISIIAVDNSITPITSLAPCTPNTTLSQLIRGAVIDERRIAMSLITRELHPPNQRNTIASARWRRARDPRDPKVFSEISRWADVRILMPFGVADIPGQYLLSINARKSVFATAAAERLPNELARGNLVTFDIARAPRRCCAWRRVRRNEGASR